MDSDNTVYPRAASNLVATMSNSNDTNAEQYIPINAPEEEEPLRVPKSARFLSTWRDVTYLGATIFVFAALLFIGTRISHISRASMETRGRPQNCGSSAAEARASGCTWDQLTWAWYPPNCLHYANEEFLAYHDWKFWVDPFGTQDVVGENWTLALDNKKQIWTQRGERLSHCVSSPIPTSKKSIRCLLSRDAGTGST